MVKPELGSKRVCVACGAKFYDLLKVPAVCPKCATEQPQEQPRLRRATGNVDEKRVKKAPVAGDEPDLEVETADEDVEEDVLEDTSDLEDGDDPLAADIEVESDTDEKDI